MTTITHLLRPSSWALALAFLTSSCGLGLYDLPQPPPRETWTTVSLVPGQDDKDAAARYIEARGAILRLYQALNEKNWDVAWTLLSSETQEMLNFGSPDGEGERALELGTITFPGGETVSFDPVALFVGVDLQTLADVHEGSEEAETVNRKEIFATTRAQKVKRIVVIFEMGEWKVHRTKITGGEV